MAVVCRHALALDRYVEQLKIIKRQDPPAPWKIFSYAVGGLSCVGYAPDSDLLLALSPTGRGVFDCLSGERVARQRVDEAGDWDILDRRRLTAPGIGPLDGKSIRVAGIWGGGLPVMSPDGWELGTGISLSRLAP